MSTETTPEDVACEYSAHEESGTGPAEWAVLCNWVCPHFPAEWRFFCDGCWECRSRPRSGFLRCFTCNHRIPANADVLRVERLRPPP